MSSTLMSLAYEVATGKKALGDLAPRAKKQVQYILTNMGEQQVRDLATHKPSSTKIGQRAYLSRKVIVR